MIAVLRASRTSPSHNASQPPPIRPGNILDAEMSVVQKTISLIIHKFNGQIQINDEPAHTKHMSLISVIVDHGVREETRG